MSAAERIAQARGHLRKGGVPATSARYLRSRQHAQAWPEDSARMRALDALPRALDALEAVLAEHAPVNALDVARRPGQQLTRVCAGCGTDDGNYQYWPCPTVRAINAALRGES